MIDFGDNPETPIYLPETPQIYLPTTPPVVKGPNLLTSSWDSIKNFFTGKNVNTAGMTDQQAKLAQGAQLRQNMGSLFAVVGAANQAVGAYYQAKTAQYQEKSAALSYGYQADMAAINSRQAEYAAQQTLEAGKSQVQQYTMAAGQEKAASTAEMAAHGVVLGAGSARDVAASQDVIKSMDVLTINSNATRQAWAQRMQGAGLAGQAILDRASAVSAAAGAHVISPFSAVSTSLLGSATQFASQWDYRRQMELRLGARDPYGYYPGAAGLNG